ncbi:MAG TPA: nickel pincer cofactor biosynthesis protein LarB [Holophagaceae bacterium]|jgi:NCAIR mutase (PurE)-related protein|nr:nickel pincer cofactor biosynthesis protein LarB [Holophagaceae bacterium]
MKPDIRWDHDRESRTGIPEVVFGPGKTHEHLHKLFTEGEEFRLATRLSPEQMDALAPLATVDRVSRTAVRTPKAAKNLPPVGIITAGTGDIPVASEARATLEAMGYPARTFFDVGVAGLHRLQAILPDLKACPVLIACAGMEGALPSVVAGLVDAPLIAVPTSVGAGVSEGGHVALMSMLASCSPGIAVVNIDNGFGAACMAMKMMNQFSRKP